MTTFVLKKPVILLALAFAAYWWFVMRPAQDQAKNAPPPAAVGK